MKIKMCPAVRYNYGIVREEEKKAKLKQWTPGFRVKYSITGKNKLREQEKATSEEVLEIFDHWIQKVIDEEDGGASHPQQQISATFEVQNNETKHELHLNYTQERWEIFYVRPKKVRGFMGLSAKTVKDYTTSINTRDPKKVKELLRKLLNGDTDYLDQKII